MSTPAERLAALIRIPTVSDPATRDAATFAAFRDRLAELYPLVHARLEREVVGGGALHLVWRGGDARPIVLMAHHDVVPVTDQPWQRDPFGGEIVDGVVHGRGTLDDKGPLVAVLEAVEGLLAEGFVPTGDVHVVSGHDEEVRGSGARAIAELLAAQGVRPSLVLDEGGAVVEGVVPGVRGPLAMIGLTERGMADVRLTTRSSGGHAAIPPRRQATVRLATALTRIERHPFPAAQQCRRRRDGRGARPAAAGTDRHRAAVPCLGPCSRAAARRDRRGVGGAGPHDRRRHAPPRGGGGERPRGRGDGGSEHPDRPGGSVQGVLDRLRRVVHDPSVGIELLAGDEPPPLSRSDGPAWDRVAAAVRAAYPDALPVPYVMVQASDARHYGDLGAEVYRFMPFAITADELAAIHGADERVSIRSLAAAIAFHRNLLSGR